MVYAVGAHPTAGFCQLMVTLDPLDEVESPVTTAGTRPQPPPPTVTTTSFDGPLVPLAFTASTRTKYTPAPTPVAVSGGAAEPGFQLTRFANPLDDPP